MFHSSPNQFKQSTNESSQVCLKHDNNVRLLKSPIVYNFVCVVGGTSTLFFVSYKETFIIKFPVNESCKTWWELKYFYEYLYFDGRLTDFL